ncbi:MAG: iron uptake porin [Chloroflexaceae bacterium]|nr:iron uptake porin [Chloroflexaceae bacterium]
MCPGLAWLFIFGQSAIAQPLEWLPFEPAGSYQERTTGRGDSVTRSKIIPVSELQNQRTGETRQGLVEDWQCWDAATDPFSPEDVTRNEVGFILNHCLEQISSQTVPGSMSDERLGKIPQGLQRFNQEIRREENRVRILEKALTALESQAFAPTARLDGTVVATTAVALGDRRADGDGDIDGQATLAQRSRLRVNVSFSGKDNLRLGLEAANFPNLSDATGTDAARLGVDTNTNNAFVLEDLIYRWPIGDDIRLWIGANQFTFDDLSDVHNPLLSSSALVASLGFIVVIQRYFAMGRIKVWERIFA